MAKLKQEEPQVATMDEAAHAPKGSFLPKPMLALFALVLAAGILVGATRHSRTASAMYDAMEACDASVSAEKDGLIDTYGIVKFNYKQTDIAAMLSLCDTNPPLAREIFRTALDRRSKSSQLIALSCSFYLAGSGQLDKEDWDRLVDCVNPEKEKNEGVRKAAQRAVSDLTFIADPAKAAAYQIVPGGVKEPDGLTNQIKTHEEKLKESGKTGLNVRWTHADLAFAWLKENASKGNWDNKLQRFVLEK